MRSFIAALFSIYICAAFASSVMAQSPQRDAPLQMAPRVLSDQFRGHIKALRDHTRELTLEDARALLDQGAFEPVTTKTPDFGFTPEPIWLHILMENPTDQDDWRLRLRENFFQEFSAWHLPSNAPPQLLEMQDESTGFETRNVQWPELVVAFTQNPGEQAAILIRYRSGGSTEVEISLFDAPTFAAWADRMTARNSIYYGMLIFLILAAIATWVGTRQGIFIAYAAYATSGLLFIMHGDGTTFRYLWPNAPEFNAFATIPLGAAIVTLGANFAREFLQTRVYHPIFDRLMVATIVLTIATALCSAVADTQVIKKLLVLLAFFATLLFTASGLNAARTRFREVRFYVLAWCGAVISSAIMTSRHWFGIEISEEVQIDSMRIVFVLDAALMGLAILDRFNGLRRSRAEALEASLIQAERNLSLSRRMQTLEQRYAWAFDLARSREHRVADAIHDLRQPLHALRMNVQDLLSEAPSRAEQGQEIEESFAFLERLVTEELEGHATDLPALQRGAEPVVLADILHAAAQMFRADAQEKGLEIKVIKTDARLRLPAIAVMRIMTNLVSNAVRYTDKGQIIIGAMRRENGGLRIEVHDTGPGMSEQDFRGALPREARLEQTADKPGSGLGLAIVAQTCATHGLQFERLPARRTGTSLAIILGPEHLA